MPDVLWRRPRDPQAEPIVDCAVYVDGERLPGAFSPGTAHDHVDATGRGFVWLGLHEPGHDQMQTIADVFALHPLVVEDAVQAFQRPKLERYDDTLFLVLKTVHYIPHESAAVGQVVETGEIMICFARDHVITTRHGDFSGLADLRARLQAQPGVLAQGPYSVIHAIIRDVVESYRALTAQIEADIEAMDAELWARGAAVSIEDIYLLKRATIEVHRAVGPLSTALKQLVAEHGDLVPADLMSYLRDLINLQAEAAARISTFDGVIGDLLEAAMGRIAVQQNDDMRKISAWGSLIVVVTLVSGIYGMRFDNIPELHWAWGYAAVLILMAGICAFLYVFFRRNRWS
jgi:magnesium transporter